MWLKGKQSVETGQTQLPEDQPELRYQSGAVFQGQAARVGSDLPRTRIGAEGDRGGRGEGRAVGATATDGMRYGPGLLLLKTGRQRSGNALGIEFRN